MHCSLILLAFKTISRYINSVHWITQILSHYCFVEAYHSQSLKQHNSALLCGIFCILTSRKFPWGIKFKRSVKCLSATKSFYESRVETANKRLWRLIGCDTGVKPLLSKAYFDLGSKLLRVGVCLHTIRIVTNYWVQTQKAIYRCCFLPHCCRCSFIKEYDVARVFTPKINEEYVWVLLRVKMSKEWWKKFETDTSLMGLSLVHPMCLKVEWSISKCN